MSDTRTCWAPGDQEHDHEMCNDSVAERVERRVAELTDEQRALYADFAAELGEDEADRLVRIIGGDALADALAMDLEARRS